MRVPMILSLTALAVSACGSPLTERSPINYVKLQGNQIVRTTAADPAAIGCQDYHKSVVLWDRAESYPPTMSPADADAICRDPRENALERATGLPLDGIYTGPNVSDRPLVDAANRQVSHLPSDVDAR